MPKRDFYRVEEILICTRPYWTSPRTLVRVAKRKTTFGKVEYFVTALDAPVGHGVWVEGEHLVRLSPIEKLALALDRNINV